MSDDLDEYVDERDRREPGFGARVADRFVSMTPEEAAAYEGPTAEDFRAELLRADAALQRTPRFSHRRRRR